MAAFSLMARFVPDDFIPTVKNQRWARITFCIDHDEVERQTEMFIDHEFKRSYTDWQKCWRNWIRKADEIQTMRRPHIPKTPEELSEEQKSIDAEAGWATLNRFKVVK